MTKKQIPDNRFEKDSNEILLELYRQSYVHARHAEQMRAAYFNFYLLALGGGIASIVAVTQSSFSANRQLIWEPVAAVGFFIWAISVLTILRAERWGGHVIHDLVTVRRSLNAFRREFPALVEIIPARQTPLANLAFDRKIWDRGKSIEPLTAMLGAFAATLITAAALPLAIWAQLGIIVVGFLVPVWQWRSEIAYLKKRHEHCCIRDT